LAGLAFKSKSVFGTFNFFISFKDENIFSCLTHLPIMQSTSSRQALWFVHKCAPIFDEVKNYGFTGAYPPKNMQILLQCYGYHQILQNDSRLQRELHSLVTSAK